MKRENTFKVISKTIIEKLSDRQGFDGWWGNIDDDIQKEILKEIEDIVKTAILNSIME